LNLVACGLGSGYVNREQRLRFSEGAGRERRESEGESERQRAREIQREEVMERPSEFRLLLQSKEQELINLCDQQIQSLHTRVIISLFLTSSYASHIASATVPVGNKKIST
jgi:hypothetical protein